MEKDKMMTTLEKIEKLIVDGQQDVLIKMGQVEAGLGQRIDGVEMRIDGVEKRIGGVDIKIERLGKSLGKEIKDVYVFLSHDIAEVDKKLSQQLNRVENKLDAHLRQPTHA